MKSTSMIASFVVLAMLGASFGVLMNNASADQGPRDSYNYRWRDSNSPAPNVSFSWVDISSTGTASGLTGDDYWGGPYSVGFNFTYYGNTYTTFYITTNGYISFGSGSSDLSPDPIPETWNPDNFIAAYWDDLYAPSNTIYYETLGVEPTRSLVVEFSQVRELGNSNLMTFEIILNETGDVWIQYLTLSGMTGNGATVGMENSDGTAGVQYSYYTASLSDNLAVKISKGLVILDSPQTKSDKFGGIVSYDMSVTNLQSVSDYFAITAYSPNGWTLGLYDVLMNPLTDHDGDTIPDTDVIAPNATASFIVTVTIPMSPTVFQDISLVNATSFTMPSINDTCPLTTEVLAAWFAPPHSDEGWDRYVSGDYAYLYVNATLYVRVAGWYSVTAYLYTASDGYLSYQYNQSNLNTGLQTIGLKYFAWDITDSGINGPYHADLVLRDTYWDILDEDTHTTGSYVLSDFQTLPGAFVAPFSDTAVDTDSDGLWDYLQINYSVSTLYDWRFRVIAYLYDASWNDIAEQTATLDLATGTTSLQVTFDAWDIARNGYGGQFNVYLDLYAWMDYSWFYDDYEYYTTSSYAFDLFERPSALFTPPHDEHVIDLDSDSLWDYLVIDVTVNVTTEGNYSISGQMMDRWGSDEIDTATNYTHLDVGEWIVELSYLGYVIRLSGEHGPYQVNLAVMTGSTELDTDTYQTGSYTDTSFDTNPGSFTPPHSAAAVDDDGDGAYEYLIVNATVTVTMAGTYQIYAGLRDSWWNVFDEKTNTTYLEVGPNVVQLRFMGWVIRDNGRNAPFTVLLELYDSGSRLLATDSFMTPAYLYTLFQTLPASLNPPHSITPEEDDSDGLYEYLRLDASVNVINAGTYILEGILYDSGGSPICMNGTVIALPTGPSIVALRFPAFMIYANADNGNYQVYIELQDENGYELDSGYVTSAFMYYNSFDPSVPAIDSIWADVTPTIDGVMGPTEWAGAVVIDLQTVNPANGLAGSLMILNDGAYLYIAYDAYGDTTEDDYDLCSVGFDTDNDDLLTDGREDQFYLRAYYWDPTYHFVYESSWSSWTTHCSPFDDTGTDHTGLAGVAGFGTSTGHATDHRIYELSIPLSLLGTAPGESIGFLGRSYNYFGIYDDYTGDESAWPMMSQTQPTISQYGELNLASGSVAGPPVTTAIPAGTAGSGGWYRSDVSVSLSTTGGKGGVDYTEYRLNGGSWTLYTAPIQMTTEGNHTLEFRSVDNFGQVETTKNVAVKIDKGVPTAASTVSGHTIWLNGTDSLSGIGSIMYRIDNGSWTAYSVALTISGAGTHVVEFYALDAAGNQQSTQSVTIVIEADDELPGDTESFPMIWLGLIGAIIAAILIVLLLVMRRKKGQAPMPMAPPPYGAMVQGPPPPPPPPQ